MTDRLKELFGMRVIESPLCEFRVPVRMHKKRRGQSLAYHARIQKKWTKRYGLKLERVAFVFNPSVIGLPLPQTMALHPKDFAIIRNLT